jgi:hypothetical protein
MILAASLGEAGVERNTTHRVVLTLRRRSVLPATAERTTTRLGLLPVMPKVSTFLAATIRADMAGHRHLHIPAATSGAYVAELLHRAELCKTAPTTCCYLSAGFAARA